MAAPPKPFAIALVLYTVGGAIGLVFASQDNASDMGTVAGAAAFGLTIAVLLWFFAARSHGGRSECLLVLLVASIGPQVAFLDRRSFLALADAAALAVLLRGWSTIEQQERSRRLGAA